MLVVPVLYSMVVGHPIEPGSILEQVQEIFTNAATLGVIALWVIFKEKRPFSSLGFRGGRGIPTFLLGVVGGFAMFLVPVGLLMVTGQYQVVDAGTKWVAVVLPAVGFAVIHMNFNPLPLLNITVVAIFFSFVALRQGSLWLVAGLHTGWNYIQGNILGIPVSGNARSTSLVFLGPTDGSLDWLTGGEFGIEGGGAATMVLVALAVWSYFAFRSHRRALGPVGAWRPRLLRLDSPRRNHDPAPAPSGQYRAEHQRTPAPPPRRCPPALDARGDPQCALPRSAEHGGGA